MKVAQRGLLVPGLVMAAVIAGCGSSSSSTSASAPAATTTAAPSANTTPPAAAGTVKLAARKVGGVGTVLVDGQGRTLYAFAPDHATKVTCTGDCAKVWPPLRAPSAAKASTAGQVNAGLVSSAADPAGGRVVTYHGWPLYRYAGDQGPGKANGQGLNLNGGVWWAITPAGKVVAQAAGAGSAAASGSNMSGGSYGY